MAGLIINDPYGGGQELISSGRSQIPLRETYSVDPRAASSQYSDRMRNVNQLVDSLSSLTKTIGGIEDQNRKLEADNAEAYVAEVSGKLNSADPVDKQLAALRPDLNPWTRAAMTQIIARQHAQGIAQSAIENMPMEARQTPEASQAYFDDVIKKEAARVGGQPFYTSPFVGALREKFGQRSGQLSSERTVEMTKAMREDGRTQQYNAMDGLIKTGQLPVDPAKAPNPEEASEIVAFSQKLGVSPLNVAMLLQGQQAQSTPDQFGAVPQAIPVKQRIADLERQLISSGIKPGATFADMYKAVNPKGNVAEDTKAFLPRAAETLGLPLDGRSTTVGGKDGPTAGAIIDRTNSVDEFTKQRWAGFGPLNKIEGFVVHHTGGRGTVEGVIETFKQRNYPVHYVIDRDGRVHQILSDTQQSQHIKPSRINNLSNANSIGVEIIAKDDSDVTPAQVAAARTLIADKGKQYGFGPNMVFGHGEVNGHKQSTEGMSVVNAVRQGGFDSVAPASSAPAADFKNDIYRKALDLGMPNHVARIAAAMASLESNDGKSELASKSNNLFGVKADTSWIGDSVVHNTSEEVNGKRVRVDAKFRKYASTDESLKDWWEKVQKDYPKVVSSTTFEEATAGFQQGVKGAYATDSNYGTKLAQRNTGIEEVSQAVKPPNPNDPDNQPLSPEAYQLRQVFFNVDGVQDKTHPLYSRTQRKQDAIANVKQIAMQSLNPDLLSAIPTSMMTPAEREDVSNWSLSIRKEVQAQQNAAWTQRARSQELAVEEANKKVNDALIKLKGGQELDSDQRAKLMLDLNQIDPKLADGFAEKYNRIQTGKLDPKMEGEIYRDLEQQLYDTVSSGGDPTKVPVGRQTDPELSKKLGDLARSLAKDGGELRETFYKDAYGKAMGSIYGMVGEGAAIRINNPGVYTYMMSSFNRFLIEEVNKFKTQTGTSNITADDQRSMIFNNTLKRVLQSYPQEVGADGGNTVQKILNDGVIPPGAKTSTENDTEKKRTEEAAKKFGFGKQ